MSMEVLKVAANSKPQKVAGALTAVIKEKELLSFRQLEQVL